MRYESTNSVAAIRCWAFRFKLGRSFYLSEEAFIEPQVCESSDQRSLNVASVPPEAYGKNYNRGSRRGSALRWSSSRHGRIRISRHSKPTTLADSRGDCGRSCISV